MPALAAAAWAWIGVMWYCSVGPDVEDDPAAALAQGRERGPAGVEGAEEVDLDDGPGPLGDSAAAGARKLPAAPLTTGSSLPKRALRATTGSTCSGCGRRRRPPSPRRLPRPQLGAVASSTSGLRLTMMTAAPMARRSAGDALADARAAATGSGRHGREDVGPEDARIEGVR